MSRDRETEDTEPPAIMEHSTFRIPYEELNQVYHNGHKRVQRASMALKKTAEMIKPRLQTSGNDYVPVAEVADLFDKVIQRTQELRQSIRRAHDSEESIVQIMKKRVEIVDAENTRQCSSNPLDVWRSQRDRTCRLAAAHMLRAGRIETAKAIASKLGFTNIIDYEVFARGKHIEEQLLSMNTKPCIEWIVEHHNGLRHIPSRLEILVRIQDVVIMLKAGKIAEALAYTKKYLSIKDMNGSVDDLRALWGLFGLGVNTPIAPYNSLLRDERWIMLAEMFTEEFSALYKLPSHSTFSLCIQCGLAAFKTPECGPERNERCVTCQPSTFALAEDLPYAHASYSVLLCWISGEPMNEDNPPMMLPNGRVYGLRSLERMCENGRIRCPKTNTYFPLNECLRVYIL